MSEKTRTERAVAAAADAGRERGLTVTDPAVLYDVFSVVVHLRPAPVVARVPTVLPPVPGALDDVRANQRRELDVTRWLDDRGVPVSRPSPLVPAEPVERDGFSLTFWELFEPDGAEPDYTANAVRTAELHQALRQYPRELPFMSALSPSIPEVRDQLAARPDLLDPADLDRAEREWAALAPVVTSADGFRAAFPGADLQVIHGDSPPFNIVTTTDGIRFADFELVTYGPVEWDLTFAGADGVRGYGDAAQGLGLRRLDERALAVLEAARMLQLVGCLSMAPQLPMLADGLRASLDGWRASPFAGGLAG